MKTICLFLFLMVGSLAIANQATPDDEKYVICNIKMKDQKILKGAIVVQPLSKIQDGVQFMDTLGNKRVILPADALEMTLFYKDGKMYFESRKDLMKALFPSRVASNQFVNRISKGRMALYYFVEKQMKMEGLDQIEAEVGRYYVKVDDEWIAISSNVFKNDCRKLFSVLRKLGYKDKIKDLEREFIEGAYKFEDTPALINRCRYLCGLNEQ